MPKRVMYQENICLDNKNITLRGIARGANKVVSVYVSWKFKAIATMGLEIPEAGKHNMICIFIILMPKA